MWNPFSSRTPSPLSLRKARHVLKSSYSLYKKQGDRLSARDYARMEEILQQLDQALLAKDREKASELAHAAEAFCTKHFPRSFFSYAKELLIAVGFAFLVAIFVRQIWFEPYQIPSGSMRPTFEEKDRLTVTKTAFGINFPFRTGHLYFDPDLVQRGSALIFSSDGIEFLDGNTSYFWIFPYKKRVIKRLIGKPGDTLYFYGGQIYGIDSDGNDISELRDTPWMQKLDFVPYMSFDGRKSHQPNRKNQKTQILFHQMNQPLARLVFPRPGEIVGEIHTKEGWKRDRPDLATKPRNAPVTYGDFWGMSGYAMTRLLTKEEVLRYTDQPLEGLSNGVLYLEVRHNPSTSFPQPKMIPRGYDQYEPVLEPFQSLIPLNEAHLQAVMDAMYTARFVVKGGRAYRYSMVEEKQPRVTQVDFSDVPDGVYEFYHGRAFSMDWAGIASSLPADHPLYSLNPKNVQRLYNLGIEFSTDFIPHSRFQTTFPNRYAYYRGGDLFLMGKTVLGKEDPALRDFIVREENRLAEATPEKPYIPFLDAGAPLVNGKIDGDKIRRFGVEVPPKSYLVLGDNHAMSGDSRLFGFLPEANIQGAPSLIFWPPSDRVGPPSQKPYPWINLPRAIIWLIFGTLGIGYLVWNRRQKNRPLFRPIPRPLSKNS